MKNCYLIFLATFTFFITSLNFGYANNNPEIFFTETATFKDGSVEKVNYTYSEYLNTFSNKSGEKISAERLAYFGENMVDYYACSIVGSDGNCYVNCCNPQCWNAHLSCMCILHPHPSCDGTAPQDPSPGS